MIAREFFTEEEIEYGVTEKTIESVDGFEIIAIVYDDDYEGEFYVGGEAGDGDLCFTFEEAENVLADMRAEKAENERIYASH